MQVGEPSMLWRPRGSGKRCIDKYKVSASFTLSWAYTAFTVFNPCIFSLWQICLFQLNPLSAIFFLMANAPHVTTFAALLTDSVILSRSSNQLPRVNSTNSFADDEASAGKKLPTWELICEDTAASPATRLHCLLGPLL